MALATAIGRLKRGQIVTHTPQIVANADRVGVQPLRWLFLFYDGRDHSEKHQQPEYCHDDRDCQDDSLEPARALSCSAMRATAARRIHWPSATLALAYVGHCDTFLADRRPCSLLPPRGGGRIGRI
jgi:hypothetical protein